MNCPNCRHGVELTWTRYLKSLSGKHDCPRCATTFKFRIPARYWVLWFDILGAAVLSALGLLQIVEILTGYACDDPLARCLLIATPALFWGTVFLVLNRRALNRLESIAV